MATTINSLVLRLALRIDPRIKTSGALFTSGTIGSSDGDRFTAQRLVDIYNEARKVLAKSIYEYYPAGKASELLSGIIKTATASFSNDGNTSEADMPSDLLRTISLSYNSDGTPIVILDSQTYQEVYREINPHLTASSTKPFVIEIGTKWIDYKAKITNTLEAKVWYYGLTNITTALSGDEVFNPDLEHILMEVAEAIAMEQGSADVMKLAKTLLAQRGE